MAKDFSQRTSRMQLVFPQSVMLRIDRLQEQIPARSKSATLRAAIDLYFLLLEEKTAGSDILLITQTELGPKEREVLIL